MSCGTPNNSCLLGNALETAADPGAASGGRDPNLCAVSVLTLDAPTEHAHYAHAEHAAYAAEVMLLSRNLVVRGSLDSE